MQKADIISLARRLRKRARRDPFLLARREGVTVSFCAFQKQLGAYCVLDGVPILLLNGKLSRKQKRQICAHEMGHHFLHSRQLLPLNKSPRSPFAKRAEKEADLFAAAFLGKDGADSALRRAKS